MSAAVKSFAKGMARRPVTLLTGSAVGLYAMQYGKKVAHEKNVESIRKSAAETPWATRDQNIARLKNQQFDLIVVGGGASGCGAALDAATRGLNVALIEAEDFGSGTSSRSTKLIWAGSRYLVQGLVKLFSLQFFRDPAGTVTDFMGTFNMVLGCHRERRFLCEMNPHLIHWLPIAVPLDRWFLWPPPFDYPPAAIGPLGVFPLFFKFYDFLGGFCSPHSYIMSVDRAKQEFPQLAARSQRTMKYINVFYEGQHNDARTNLAIGLTAAKHGAAIANYTSMTEVLKDASGKANGIKCKDAQTGEEYNVKGATVLFAGGPYTDDMRMINEGASCEKCIRGATGTHIVLPGYFTPKDMGFVDMSTSDGRFLFVLNWLGHTVVGTTDSPTPKPTLHQKPSEDEIQWILNEASKYLHNSTGLSRDHVLSAWQGTRPLVRDPNADPNKTSSASRDHTISRHEASGVTFLSGGKWTTYREMAEDAINHVLEHAPELAKKAKPCKTLETPLIGAGPTSKAPNGWHKNLKFELASQYGLSYDVADNMANTYGTRAHEVLDYAKDVKPSKTGLSKHYGRLYDGYPYIEPEIRYAVHKEYAVTAADIISRRTRLAFLNIQAAELVLPRVCQVMGEELGWSKQRIQQEVDNTRKVLSWNFLGNPVGEAAAKANVDNVGGVVLTRDSPVPMADQQGLAFG